MCNSFHYGRHQCDCQYLRRCTPPAQNYVTQIVRDTVADRLGEVSLIPYTAISYTVATLPILTVTPLRDGTMVYCLDGDAGKPCIAVLSGQLWKRIPLGDAVSTT